MDEHSDDEKYLTLKQKIIKNNKETIQNSTIHGVPMLAKTPHTLIRLMWIICISASSAYCAYSIYNCFVQYFEYQVVTQVEIEYLNELEFPMVKICRADMGLPYNETNIKEKVEIQTALLYLSNLYSSYSTDLQKTIGIKDLNDILITCIYNLNPCNNTNDFEYYFDFNYGGCYRFNSGKNMLNQLVPIKKLAQTGPLNGLQLEFYIGQAIENNNLYAIDNGLNILISNETSDSTGKEGLMVSPGFSTYIVLNKYSISEQPKPYSNCVAHLDRIDAYDSIAFKLTFQNNQNLRKKYHLRDCFYTCLQKYLGDTCNCQDSLNQPYYQSKRKCNNKADLKCFLTSYTSFSADPKLLDACDCPLECEIIDYSITLSYSEYPTQYYAKILATHSLIQSKFPDGNVTFEKLKHSIASIFIFYNSLQQSVVSHDIKMVASDLLAIIGGNLGLFLGVSFLTSIEFVEMFVQTIVVVLQNKNKNTPDFDDEPKKNKNDDNR